MVDRLVIGQRGIITRSRAKQPKPKQTPQQTQEAKELTAKQQRIKKFEEKLAEEDARIAIFDQKIADQEQRIAEARAGDFERWRSVRGRLFNQLDALTDTRGRLRRERNQVNRNLNRARAGLRRKKTALTSTNESRQNKLLGINPDGSFVKGGAAARAIAARPKRQSFIEQSNVFRDDNPVASTPTGGFILQSGARAEPRQSAADGSTVFSIEQNRSPFLRDQNFTADPALQRQQAESQRAKNLFTAATSEELRPPRREQQAESFGANIIERQAAFTAREDQRLAARENRALRTVGSLTADPIGDIKRFLTFQEPEPVNLTRGDQFVQRLNTLDQSSSQTVRLTGLIGRSSAGIVDPGLFVAAPTQALRKATLEGQVNLFGSDSQRSILREQKPTQTQALTRGTGLSLFTEGKLYAEGALGLATAGAGAALTIPQVRGSLGRASGRTRFSGSFLDERTATNIPTKVKNLPSRKQGFLEFETKAISPFERTQRGRIVVSDEGTTIFQTGGKVRQVTILDNTGRGRVTRTRGDTQLFSREINQPAGQSLLKFDDLTKSFDVKPTTVNFFEEGGFSLRQRRTGEINRDVSLRLDENKFIQNVADIKITGSRTQEASQRVLPVYEATGSFDIFSGRALPGQIREVRPTLGRKTADPELQNFMQTANQFEGVRIAGFSQFNDLVGGEVITGSIRPAFPVENIFKERLSVSFSGTARKQLGFEINPPRLGKRGQARSIFQERQQPNIIERPFNINPTDLTTSFQRLGFGRSTIPKPLTRSRSALGVRQSLLSSLASKSQSQRRNQFTPQSTKPLSGSVFDLTQSFRIDQRQRQAQRSLLISSLASSLGTSTQTTTTTTPPFRGGRPGLFTTRRGFLPKFNLNLNNGGSQRRKSNKSLNRNRNFKISRSFSNVGFGIQGISVNTKDITGLFIRG